MASSSSVMELADGETLAERIRRGPIPVDDAIPIFRQIADAVRGDRLVPELSVEPSHPIRLRVGEGSFDVTEELALEDTFR